MDDRPALSDHDIRTRIDERSYARGFSYHQSGAVSHRQREGATIRARVQGSQPAPYRVWARIGPEGIVDADCSCPVGDGGYCKHVAAMLLDWLEDPDAFRAVEALDTRLAGRSQAELIALIKQMLRREPDLEDLLDVPLPASGRHLTTADRQALRREAEAAFEEPEEYEYGRGVESMIAERLANVVDIGDGYRDQGDIAGAVGAYTTVLETVAEHLGEIPNETGEVYEIEEECVERLGACLQALAPATAADQRREILKALFGVLTAEVEGYAEMWSEAIPEVLIENTTPAERADVAIWVRDAIDRQRATTEDWVSHVWGDLLLDLEMETLDDDAFIQISRETGQTARLVDRLLEVGRTPEAIDAVRGAAPHELLGLADRLADAGQGEAAEEIVADRLPAEPEYLQIPMLDWLRTRATTRGDQERALTLARQRYELQPDFTTYQQIRSLAGRLGQWPAMRPDLIARIQTGTQRGLLLRIYLDEGEIDRALEAAEGAPLFGLALGGSAGPLQVAEVAEATRPEAALRIYAAYVEAYIDQRSRPSYQQAVRLLTQMRDLYERLGHQQEWNTYLVDLRERNTRLRALKEEMERAGL